MIHKVHIGLLPKGSSPLLTKQPSPFRPRPDPRRTGRGHGRSAPAAPAGCWRATTRERSQSAGDPHRSRSGLAGRRVARSRAPGGPGIGPGEDAPRGAQAPRTHRRQHAARYTLSPWATQALPSSPAWSLVYLPVFASITAARIIQNLLFGIRTVDPWVMLMVAPLFLAAAVPAVFVPARSAAAVDPMGAGMHGCLQRQGLSGV
jgi:hypothetical protein